MNKESSTAIVVWTDAAMRIAPRKTTSQRTLRTNEPKEGSFGASAPNSSSTPKPARIEAEKWVTRIKRLASRATSRPGKRYNTPCRNENSPHVYRKEKSARATKYFTHLF